MQHILNNLWSCQQSTRFQLVSMAEWNLCLIWMIRPTQNNYACESSNQASRCQFSQVPFEPRYGAVYGIIKGILVGLLTPNKIEIKLHWINLWDIYLVHPALNMDVIWASIACPLPQTIPGRWLITNIKTHSLLLCSLQSVLMLYITHSRYTRSIWYHSILNSPKFPKWYFPSVRTHCHDLNRFW